MDASDPVSTRSTRSPEPDQSSLVETRTVELVRGGHRWRISCPMDERGLLLLDLLEMAEDPSVPLSSLDVDLIVRGFRDESAGPSSLQPDRLVSQPAAANGSQS